MKKGFPQFSSQFHFIEEKRSLIYDNAFITWQGFWCYLPCLCLVILRYKFQRRDKTPDNASVYICHMWIWVWERRNCLHMQQMRKGALGKYVRQYLNMYLYVYVCVCVCLRVRTITDLKAFASRMLWETFKMIKYANIFILYIIFLYTLFFSISNTRMTAVNKNGSKL